jgi:uncharacterized protein (DUF433 family)
MTMATQHPQGDGRGDVPGIIREDGGRVARIAGTGLEVFEIVHAYRKMDESWERLCKAFHWLSDDQLRAALRYAEVYADEVNARLEEEDAWERPEVWEALQRKLAQRRR